MPLALHKKWHLIPTGRPGQRFRQRYRQHQRSRQGRGLLKMILRFVLAGVATLIGFVLVFIPGPAVVFFLIAGALLAADWFAVAKLLDWAEVRGRRVWTKARAIWVKLSRPAKLGLVAAGAILSAATTWGFYQVMH